MLIKIRSLDELKQTFILNVRNKTDKVTKVIATSVINGFAYGFAKLAQKINTDAAYLEAKLFPEYAIGDVLDNISLREGFPQRLSASKSSIILQIKADPGTVYPILTKFSGSANLTFELDSELVVGSTGIAYATATSTLTGKTTLVPAYSVDKILGVVPSTHISVINPSSSIGGQDLETDYEYRARIMNLNNILSSNTEVFYTELIYKIQPEIIKITTNSYQHFYKNF